MTAPSEGRGPFREAAHAARYRYAQDETRPQTGRFAAPADFRIDGMLALEANLLMLALGNPRCTDLGLVMAPTEPFGLQVRRNGQIMGIWSERHGVLVFRNLAKWQSRTTAATPAEAIELTIAMAIDNSWLD